MSQVFPGKGHIARACAHTHTHSSAARQPMLPRTVTHQLQVGWFASLTPTSEMPSFTPPSHPLLTPAAITQGALAEPSGQDHQASCPHSYTFYNFYLLLFLIFSSTCHPLPPHTSFCQFLESSLPTHRRQRLHFSLGLY